MVKNDIIIYTDNLNKKFGIGNNKNKLVIDWENNINNYIEFYSEMYNIRGKFIIKDYIKNKQIIKILYNNNEYEIKTANLINGKILNIIKLRTNDWKFEIGQVLKDNKRDIVIIDKKRKYGNDNRLYKWYKYHCNKCGWDEGWIVESSLLKGTSCSCCSGRTVVKGINDIATTDAWMTPYFVNIKDCYIYTHNSNNKVLCKCIDCKTTRNISIYNLYLNGFSCPKCSDRISYPNKFMFNLLQEPGIEFINEYSPEWIKPKRYDFYIPSKNLIIEMDGGLGHGNRTYDKYKKTIEDTIKDDNYKDKLAKEHNIKVIRIDCDYDNIENRFNFIKNNIINSKLNEIFNLTNIDWNKIGLNSEKNIFKEVCNYWYIHNNINNENITSSDIEKIFSINKGTISRWLNKGNELNWCKYNPKEEIKKTCSKNGKSLGKKIEIFKNYVSLGIFYSISELSRQSEELFGVKLTASRIRIVAKTGKKYKGYTFKYI